MHDFLYVLITGIFVLFRSNNSKRDYFLLMQAIIVIYLFGYLLELTGSNSEEAFAGAKVLYTGVSFAGAFAFFFIADYCGIKIPSFLVKIPMLTLSLFSALIMWTTRFHSLIFRDYYYDKRISIHLIFTPGPLFPLVRFYPVFCLILAIAVLLYRMNNVKSNYRRQLLFVFSCLMVPFLTEGIYIVTILTGINISHFYFTPYSLAVMSLLLYLGVMRFNIFEFISISAETAIEHIVEGYVLVDQNNHYLSSNRAATGIFPELENLTKSEPISSVKNWPAELEGRENSSVEFSIMDKDTRYFKANISHVFNKNKSVLAKIIIFNDITESVNFVKDLENAAYLDSLTGIYNRKHFYELANVELERAVRMNQTVYTAMLDLDSFKKINDTYGHAAGDIVLRESAGIIRQTIRSYDLLGRYGGEEFVLLLTKLDDSEAKKLVDRVRENIEQNITNYEGAELRVTCSIGLTRYAEQDNLEKALKKADTALYAAKKAGSNKVMVYGELF